jgi:hypothetical protein
MDLIMMIVLGTSIWVLFDALRIGIKKGQIEGFTDLSAGGWFLACLLLWIIGFPLYLVKRADYIAINTKN